MSNNTAVIIGVFDPSTELFDGTVNIMGEKIPFVDDTNQDESPVTQILDELGEKYLSQFDETQKFEVVITIKPV